MQSASYARPAWTFNFYIGGQGREATYLHFSSSVSCTQQIFTKKLLKCYNYTFVHSDMYIKAQFKVNLS